MTEPTRVTYLGFAVPDEIYADVAATDRGLKASSHAFGWLLIRALKAAGSTVTNISADPRSDFPHNSRVLVRSRQFVQEQVRGRTLSYVNLLGLKHITRYVAAFFALRRIGKTAGPQAVIVHGVNSSFLWAALHARRVGMGPIVAVLTDAPSLRTRFDNGLSGLMKRLDRRLILAALKRIDGAIALTPGLAEDFAPGRPWMHLEGISSEPRGVQVPPAQSRVVMYAGTLNPAYGVEELLDSVALSKGDWELHVYGRGALEPLVAHRSEAERRISFFGAVSRDQVFEAYNRAALLVNPRPPDADYVRYAFPSKLMEYMASGIRVVTTVQPDLPADYLPHVAASGPGAADLAQALDAEMARSPHERSDDATRAQDFILRSRGPAAQGSRMMAFLVDLECRTVRRTGIASTVRGSDLVD